MLNLEQLNQSFGEYQLKQIKVKDDHEMKISNLFERVNTLEKAKEVQRGINAQLLNPSTPEKKSWWERLWK